MRFSSRQAGFLTVAVFMLFLGCYATKLNADFYRDHVPFFDSCEYGNELAATLASVRSEGVSTAVQQALHKNVALPWLEAIAFERFIPNSRAVGVWLQWVWLTALALSLYWYFVRFRNVPPVLSICFTLPFVCFSRIFDWAAGLPDFRMDLSLYIFVSLTAVWYLAGYETESIGPWLLAGIAAMLACIARATAPVYLAIMIGPLWTTQMFCAAPEQRWPLVRKTISMLAPALAGLLFQVYNFRFLYFYYITNSGDPNSRLPLSKSALHLVISGSHLGVVMAVCSLAILALSFRTEFAARIRQIDWRVFWLAWAPPLFLVLAGAGLNPFVSMPAVFGFLMFSYLPLRKTVIAATAGSTRWAACVLLLGSCFYNVAEARHPQLFVGGNTTRMDGVKALIDHIEFDATSHRSRQAPYIIPEIGDFHSCAFSNVLIYDYGGTPETDGSIRLPSGRRYSFPREDAFSAPSRYPWDRALAGNTDEEKMDTLISIAAAKADYLLLPTGLTIDFLERYRSSNFINLRARELKRRLLLTGVWSKLGDPVAISPNESIQPYTRLRKIEQ